MLFTHFGVTSGITQYPGNWNIFKLEVGLNQVSDIPITEKSCLRQDKRKTKSS